MTRTKKVTAEFKAKVAIEAIKERESLTALATRFGVVPSVITKWKEVVFQFVCPQLCNFRDTLQN